MYRITKLRFYKYEVKLFLSKFVICRKIEFAYSLFSITGLGVH